MRNGRPARLPSPVTGSGDGIFLTGTKIDELHLNDAVLAAYAGAYSSTELNATYKLSVENGILVLRNNNWNSPLKLNPLVRDEFESGDIGTLVFQRDADGRISGLSVFAGRIRICAGTPGWNLRGGVP